MSYFLYSFEKAIAEMHSGLDAVVIGGMPGLPAGEALEYPANSPDSRHSLNRFSHL
jgi:hypothetical protein